MKMFTLLGTKEMQIFKRYSRSHIKLAIKKKFTADWSAFGEMYLTSNLALHIITSFKKLMTIDMVILLAGI